MLIDVTLKISAEQAELAWSNTDKSLVGHLGTHFDVMDMEFPLAYTRRNGVVFDVSSVGDQIDICHVNVDQILPSSFVAFYTGFIDKVPYGSKEYFSKHPQLSDGLIRLLLEKQVSIIGIDCGGIKRGSAHTPTDRLCARSNVFVVENLCHLNNLLCLKNRFTMHTYPLSISGVTGLPCRVIAECSN